MNVDLLELSGGVEFSKNDIQALETTTLYHNSVAIRYKNENSYLFTNNSISLTMPQ